EGKRPIEESLQHLFRFEHKALHIDIGSVLVQKNDDFSLILGFPKIKRAMLLGPAIKFNFCDIKRVAVEEKMNGYNVRARSSYTQRPCVSLFFGES
ncbi:MAG TPA: hypothetical protein PKC27_01950, partial [Methanomethylovorans sp.]|nr:hypothetical protein [Methanomethylovorans sp.]